MCCDACLTLFKKKIFVWKSYQLFWENPHRLNQSLFILRLLQSNNKDMLGGTLSFIPFPVCRTSAATAWINESSRGLFSSMTQGSLCGPQKKIGGLIKGALGSAEWRIVMEKLDSVNVFIFSVLKFKKWNPSLAPGCALSCLKRSDYLLRLWKAGLEGLAHQLITKQQRDAVHLFFLVGKKINLRDLKIGFQTLWDHFFAHWVTVSGSVFLLLPAMLLKIVHQTYQHLDKLDLWTTVLLKPCVQFTPLQEIRHFTLVQCLFCSSDRGSWTE